MMGIEPCYVQVVSFANSHLWIWIGDRTASAPTLSLAMGQRGQAKHFLSTNGEFTFYVHSLYKSLASSITNSTLLGLKDLILFAVCVV